MNDKPKLTTINFEKQSDEIVKTVLMKAMTEELDDVLVLGWTKGKVQNLYLGASTDDSSTLNWMVQTFMHELMTWTRNNG